MRISPNSGYSTNLSVPVHDMASVHQVSSVFSDILHHSVRDTDILIYVVVLLVVTHYFVTG